MGKPAGKTSDLAVRAGVGVVLIGVALTTLWLGSHVFWLLVAVGGLLMIGEWAGLAGATPQQRLLAQYALTVPIALMSPFAAGPGFLALGFIFGAMFFVGALTRNVRLAWGMLYVGLPVLALLLLREQPSGFSLTLWTMAVVWASDSGAYFAGRAIGGPKLAPSISPNKTWAGAIGGVVSALAFSILFAVSTPEMGTGMVMILLSPLLAVLSQAGDLYESHLKRVAGVKDSGTILPGHGGLLDRLDGLVPVAPVVALVMAIHFSWGG